MTNEFRRRMVHISMVGFALCIGRIPAWAIVLLCFSALMFNVWVLPRLSKGRLERENELAKGFSVGMLAYPLVLGLLAIVFYRAQLYLAIGWGCLAFGDGFANPVGRKYPLAALPWNKQKSWGGMLAFLGAGWLGTSALVWALPYEHTAAAFPWIAIGVAVLAASIIETIDDLIDDNVSVAITGAVTAYVAQHIHWQLPMLPANVWLGLACVLALTIGSIFTKKIDLIGAITGGILTAAMFLGGGMTGIALIFSFFVLGSLASMWKKREKTTMGVAQENGGKRTYTHALANAGIAAVCGLLAWVDARHSTAFQVAMAASMAAALSDTFSSELGTIYGRRYTQLLTLAPAERGEDGAVSYEGSFAGLLGSLLMALVYGIGTGWTHAGAVFIAGVLGNVIDSVLGGSFQRWGYMNNHTVNFAAMTAAAAIGAAISLH